MTTHLFEIKYKCLHESCFASCKKGNLSLEESEFNKLSSYEDKSLLKSPKGICKLGFTQKFKIEKVKDSLSKKDNNEIITDNSSDPIEILIQEHQIVLELLDRIETHIRRRNVDGLWTSVCELENEITLHSIVKEEGVLFPLLENVGSQIIAFLGIIKEDHREVFSFLHSFKSALIDNEILDGIGHSLVANLRTHISKEDNEFFEVVNHYLTAKDKENLLIKMKKAEESFVPEEVIDLNEFAIKSKNNDNYKAREKHNEAIEAMKEMKIQSECCH